VNDLPAPFEMGSWFHLMEEFPTSSHSLFRDAKLFRSGRDALRSIVTAAPRKIRRVHVPTYFCHDVTEHIRSEFDICLYSDAPFLPSFNLEIDDDELAVVVEYFGNPAHPVVTGGLVALDRTMAPWADHRYQRNPDAVFGSLRKTVPLPDGGYAVTNQSTIGVLPEAGPSDKHETAVAQVLKAMASKSKFLAGESIDKSEFLDVLASWDHRILASGHCGISKYSKRIVHDLDLEWFASARRTNLNFLKHLHPDAWSGTRWTPAESHAVLMCSSSSLRNQLRSTLAAISVYTPLFWALPAWIEDSQARDVADSLLVLHIDHRYGIDHLHRLALVLDHVSLRHHA